MNHQEARCPRISAPVLLLAAMCGVVSVLAGHATLRPSLGTTPPDEIRLTGVVRDFYASHPDFKVAANGPHAGTTAMTLDTGRPVLNDTGYRVNTEWRDRDGRAIAPHLFGVGGGGGSDPWASAGVRVRGRLTLDKGVIDGNGVTAVVSTNSTDPGMMKLGSNFLIDGHALVGPGGNPDTVIDNNGTITGTIGAQDVAFPMPAIVVPGIDVVGPNTGDADFSGGNVYTISTNMHTDDFRLRTGAVIQIDGHVTIVVRGEFRTETEGSIHVPDGSSLDIYCTGPKITIETKAAWSNPANTRMWVVGAPGFKIQTDCSFYGSIIAPDASLLVQTKGQLFGSYVGNELTVKTEGKIHVSDGIIGGGGCLTVMDNAGAAGPAGNGGITSPASFAQWFRDVPGTNQSASHVITLTRDAAGVYHFHSDDFYPIDGRLFGNEGEPRNSNFTYAISAEFTYEECGGQFVELEGGDGLWLFIDGRLAIDLGGVGTDLRTQHLGLDRLGLVGGERYDFTLLYAQRRTPSDAVLRLRTNLELSTDGFVPVTTAQYD